MDEQKAKLLAHKREAPAKRQQHNNTTYRNIVGPVFASPAKRFQHFSVTYRNIVGPNMLRAFGYPDTACCDMLGVENRTRTQTGCNPAKRVQHHATSTNVA